MTEVTADALVDTFQFEQVAEAVDRVPVKAILLEWDQDWPEFGVLLDHLDRARALMRASRKAGERR